MQEEGLASRIRIPADGEQLSLSRAGSSERPRPADRPEPRPGFQKWLTARFSGT
jgi:hypothetical protein